MEPKTVFLAIGLSKVSDLQAIYDVPYVENGFLGFSQK